MTREAKGLYIATLALELVGALARFAVGLFLAYLIVPFFVLPVFLVQAFAALQTGQPPPILGLIKLVLVLDVLVAVATALGPIAWSLLTLQALPGGAQLTRFALGARELSRRERDAYNAALAQVAENAPKGAIGPQRVFALDQPLPNAYVVGTTLYLTRELIRNDALAPVLAHELGHLNSPDGRLTLALRRLVLPPLYLLSRNLGQVAPGLIQGGLHSETPVGCLAGGLIWGLSLLLSVAGGGFGLWLLNPLWVWFWRDREYEADRFAHRCGQAPGLIEYLERHEFFDVSVPYFLAEHPYTELRIDRLQGYLEGVEFDEPSGPPDIGPIPAPDNIQLGNRFG